MGYYNVVQPDVVVDGLHYVHPTPPNEPIEVDDDTVAELVADGKLTPYPPESGVFVAPSLEVGFVEPGPVIESEPKPRTRRRSAED